MAGGHGCLVVEEQKVSCNVEEENKGDARRYYKVVRKMEQIYQFNYFKLDYIVKTHLKNKNI